VFNNAVITLVKDSHHNTVRPLQNTPFGPISASGSKFNPLNIKYIHTVKFFALLEREQKQMFCKGLVLISKNNFRI